MRLPLFPLHAVAFPRLPLPLHVFEERYRVMVRDLLADRSPGGGRFLVAMITEGAEVGEGPMPPLTRRVGTVVEVRNARRFADGRWALLTVGVGRAAIRDVDRSGAYAVADVEELPEDAGDPVAAGRLVAEVQSALDAYLATVKRLVRSAASSGSENQESGEMTASLDEALKPIALPDEPVAASYAVGGVLQVELVRKQQLLELPDGVSRLRAELDLLRREAQLLSDAGMPPLSTTDLRFHPN